MISNKYILGVTLLLSLNFFGCSLIGLSIGSYATDDRVFITNTKEFALFALVDSAQTIKVVTKDNRTTKGELQVVSNHNVRVQVGGKIFSIPLENIKEIEIIHFPFWAVGLCAGIALDVFSFRAAAESLSSFGR